MKLFQVYLQIADREDEGVDYDNNILPGGAPRALQVFGVNMVDVIKHIQKLYPEVDIYQISHGGRKGAVVQITPEAALSMVPNVQATEVING